MMLKRHSKQDASVWDRRLTAILGMLFGVTLLLFAVLVLTLFINTAGEDDCLDRGGNYDHERGQCDFDESLPAP